MRVQKGTNTGPKPNGVNLNCICHRKLNWNDRKGNLLNCNSKKFNTGNPFWEIYLTVCLYICLSVHPSIISTHLPFFPSIHPQYLSINNIYPSVCLSFYPSISLSIHPSIHPIHSIYPSICLSICLSMHPSTVSIHQCLSICLSIYPSIHLSFHPSIYLYMVSIHQ